MIFCGHEPTSFGQSYTVAIPKVNKSLTVEAFRGISISCVLSKIFDLCILDQFGLKKKSFRMRCTVDHYTSRGTTVNIKLMNLLIIFKTDLLRV